MNEFLARLQNRFKTLDDLGGAFILFGVVLFGVGDTINLAFLRQLGLGAFGAGLVALGINAFQIRELSIFQPDISMSQRVQELIARLWGIGFTLGGLTLFGYGILTALNSRPPILFRLQEFFATPQGGDLLLVGGCILGAVFALSIIFVNDVPTGNSILRVILSVPKRLFGVLLLLGFCAVGIVSVLEIFEPGTWQNLGHFFLQRIGIE